MTDYPYFNHLPKPLISEVKIRQRIRELGELITDEYRGQDLVVVSVLKGSFIFFADLIRSIKTPLHCEFMGLSSYGSGSTSSGEVKVTLDLLEPIEGKHVLIVEDIVDTGVTMSYLLKTLSNRKPLSLKVASLLFKPDALKQPLELDYVGFRIGNEFVVGYGLDYGGRYRQLPYIGLLEHEN